MARELARTSFLAAGPGKNKGAGSSSGTAEVTVDMIRLGKPGQEGKGSFET